MTPGREESLRDSYGSGRISLLQHSVDFGYVFLRRHAARLISKLVHGEHRFRADFLIAGQLDNHFQVGGIKEFVDQLRLGLYISLDESWQNQVGIVLANTFFRTVRDTEPLRFDAEDIIGFLMRRDEGYEALEKLPDAADKLGELALLSCRDVFGRSEVIWTVCESWCVEPDTETKCGV